MDFKRANLSNLTSLWDKYGWQLANQSATGHIKANNHWPFRCWLDNALHQFPIANPDSLSWLAHVPKSAVLAFGINEYETPNNFEETALQYNEEQLLQKGWTFSFKQMAMYLDIHGRTLPQIRDRQGFQIKLVTTQADLKRWVQVASEAFNYKIDGRSIERICHVNNIKLLMGWQGEHAVATGLLYKTGDVIGIHQMGIKPEYQGQGIAKHFMQELLVKCVSWQGKVVVLQASEAGRPLYENLGFSPQFTIRNYRYSSFQ
jgi:GNAT superfamily N-acetyltransferase